jgi:hypothetical protein
MRVLLIESDPVTAQTAMRRIELHLRPAQIDHVESTAQAAESMKRHRYSLIIPAGDGAQSLVDAIIASHGQQQSHLGDRLDTIGRQLDRLESAESQRAEQFKSLQRAIYGDGHNGARGIIRRLDRIELAVQVGTAIVGAALVAMTGLAVARVFGG